MKGTQLGRRRGEEGRKEVPSKGHFQTTRRVGHGRIHKKRRGKRGGQGGDEGNRAPRYRNTRRLRTTTEAIAARGRWGGWGGHSGCRHPNGASSGLELDVLRKRGKSVSPTKDTFSESFLNGCEKTKTRIQVQTPAKDPESQKLGLGRFSVVRRGGGR